MMIASHLLLVLLGQPQCSGLRQPAHVRPMGLRMCATAPHSSRRHRRAHLQPPGSPPPVPAGPATALEPAVLAGVREDHRYEQFFFDAPTCDALLELMAEHERPLLLCTPSLAIAAEAASRRYLLLDRDERFDFLPGFRPFDLDAPAPAAVAGYEFDAVFADPPFANFELRKLEVALAVLRGERPPPPLYIAYSARREQQLVEALTEQPLQRRLRLGYMSVKPSTQKHLWLFGPAVEEGLD